MQAETQFETGDVVEFQTDEGNVRGIIKYEQPDYLGSDYTVYVNKEDYANGYLYIGADKIIGKLGEVDYDPQDPFQDADELLAPFKTVSVECDECGDEFHVSEAAMTYGAPRFCSEACGIKAGNLQEGKWDR